MKRIISVFLLTVIILFLTGCTKKVHIQVSNLEEDYNYQSIISLPLDENVYYECYSYQELHLLFNRALYNRANKLKFKICYDDFNIIDALKKLRTSEIVLEQYELNTSFLLSTFNRFTFTFRYSDKPTLSTDQKKIKNSKSVNYIPITRTRSDTFDNFCVNTFKEEKKVTSTNELITCLERKVKPLCEKGSNAEIYYEKIKQILREIISDDMSNFDKVKAIHDYIIMTANYDFVALEQSVDHFYYDCGWIEGIFDNQKAVCGALSMLFSAMCNLEGIPCVVDTGYTTQTPYENLHAWNKVCLDGAWYIVDVTNDNMFVDSLNKELLGYYFFLITDEEYQSKYTSCAYPHIKCNTSINIYEKMTYEHKGIKNYFDISTQEELNHFIDYLESNDLGTTTGAFKVSMQMDRMFTYYFAWAYQAIGVANDGSYLMQDYDFIFIV